MTHAQPQRHTPTFTQAIGRNVQRLINEPRAQTATTLRNFAQNYVPTKDDEARFRLAQRGSVMGSYDPMINAAQRLFGAGATVWHGSPHKFLPTGKNPLGEFDSVHIGKGEGAQAYGHGLYLADTQGVAKSYNEAGQP